MDTKLTLKFVFADENIDAHRSFLLQLIELGKDDWNNWNKLHFEKIEQLQIVTSSEHDLENIQKLHRLDFSNSNFTNTDLNFNGCIFGARADFNDSRFRCNSEFKNATFLGDANFSNSIFDQLAEFSSACFKKVAKFQNTEFKFLTNFIATKFFGATYFGDSTFGIHTTFNQSVFEKSVDFCRATFNSIDFKVITFNSIAFFEDTVFNKLVDFSGSIFYRTPRLSLSTEDEKLKYRFNRTRFRLNKGFVQWRSTANTVGEIERLRSITESNQAINEYRDLFVLQRQAERGSLIREWLDNKKSVKNFVNMIRGASLMFGYWLFSNYGRSTLRPIFCFLVSNIVFFQLYRFMYLRPLFARFNDAIVDFTIANSLPFGRLMNPAFEQSVRDLFVIKQTSVQNGVEVTAMIVDIPIQFQITGMLHSLTSVVLLFLIGLGIRNYFRIS